VKSKFNVTSSDAFDFRLDFKEVYLGHGKFPDWSWSVKSNAKKQAFTKMPISP
jgi:hypothetical protein